MYYPELSAGDLSFHLVEARGRILPEVGDGPGAWVVRSLERRGAHVHLDTQLVSAEDGHVVLSTGEELDSELIVWTAGNASNPVVHNHTDLNILADLRGGQVRDYRHSSLGVVATLGLGRGIFQYKGLVVKGFPAWLVHRGYHVLAVPTRERKLRVLTVWLTAAVFGRDLVSLASVQHPRQAFVSGGEPRRPGMQRTARVRN